MGVTVSTTKFSEIGKSHYLFSSFNYFKIRKFINSDLSFLEVRLSDYFEIISGFAFSSIDYTDNGISVCRIGDISKTEELLVEEMLKLPEDYYGIFDKYQIKNNDILIGMTGDGKYFKTCYVVDLTTTILLNQRVGILRLKKNINNFEPKFLSLLFRLDSVQNQIRIVAMGKTQKNVSPFDILNVRIPNVSYHLQKTILEKITPLEIKITNLKNSKLKFKDIINQVVSDEFNIQLSDVASIDSVAKLNVKLSSISPRNNNLRDSFRWNKMQHIQNYLYKDINCIHLLGNFIIGTKNGWSPLSVDGGEGIPILGQEHFSFDGVLKISPSKFTEITKNNIDDYFIQQGDFFVSRGNTVDLVALASVVEEEISEDIIFPDLYIKIQLDETRIDKKYLALLFNSFFGRLYFKYASKGKNQTMVKISSSELYDFYLPIPDIEIQRKVVKNIQTQRDAQSHIDREIEKNRAKINLIIEEAIRNPVYV